MQSACRALRHAGKSLGLVPTMGALHEGHLSLVKASKAACDATAASIFVNPTQLAPTKTWTKYPRTFEADCALLEKEGVDLVFAPSVEEMYPAGAATWVEVEGVGERLEGASRPGHLRGVATICLQALSHRCARRRPSSARKTPRSWRCCGKWSAISISIWRLSAARSFASRTAWP